MGFFSSLFGGGSSLAPSVAKVYFQARQNGYDHEYAMREMIRQRYESASYVRELVMEVFEEDGFTNRGDEDQVKYILDAMYAQEQGIPREWEDRQARSEEIEQAIDKLKEGNPGIL